MVFVLITVLQRYHFYAYYWTIYINLRNFSYNFILHVQQGYSILFIYHSLWVVSNVYTERSKPMATFDIFKKLYSFPVTLPAQHSVTCAEIFRITNTFVQGWSWMRVNSLCKGQLYVKSFLDYTTTKLKEKLSTFSRASLIFHATHYC